MAGPLHAVDAIEYGFLCFYCVLVWLYYIVAGVKTKYIFAKATQEEENELHSARDRFWNLSKQWEGLSHQFLDLKDGVRMHYVTNATPEMIASSKPIVIFFHGFPDSWAVWRHIISTPSLKEGCIIVAPDLPGYGGSDSLPDYSAANLLGHVASFVVDVRRRYERDDGQGRRRSILVAHDWGSAISFRLAAEAPQLADRFIIANGPLNSCSLNNFDNAKTTALSYLKRFKLFAAIEEAKPVLRQLLMSHYIVLFQSPIPFLRIFSTVGNYAWIRALHRHWAGLPSTAPAAEFYQFMATTLGPELKETTIATEDGEKYSASVIQRGTDFVLLHPMRYYREGAFTQVWEKSDDFKASLAQLGPSDLKDGETGRLGPVRAKTTVLWGMNDRALSDTICLRNLDKYLVPDSYIVELPRSGHGTPVEAESRVVSTKVIEWAIDGEGDDVGKAISSVYQDARVTARR
ncbi:hypothetical protein KEM56_005070 [Ascosphaera pollenicola]|nr:hypothetical protein KEM56_005070 [Ascosphaera pollenicola]